MIEDVMDNDGFNGGYKESPPLQLPQMGPPTSLRTSISPRADSVFARSSSSPWSPAPLNTVSYEKFSSERTVTSPTQIKSTFAWPNHNSSSSYSKTMDSTITSNNSSNARMIPSSEPSSSSSSSCSCLSSQVSPRCKLGILGFVIGLLAVSIPLAVVLVLWLRK